MYLKRIVLVLSLILNFNLIGQNTEQFNILNTDTKDAVFGANVLFYKEGKLVGVARSDENGKIEFNPDLDFEYFEIKKLGFQTLTYPKGTNISAVYIKPRPNEIDEVVITGQIIPGNKYQSPFKLKFYSKEEIESKNSVNLADFLQTENNFQVTQDAVLGTKVSLNGMNGQDLKILIDGIPVAGRLNGTVDFSQIRFELGRNVFLGWDQFSDSLKKTIKPLWRDEDWNPKEQYFANFSFYRILNKKAKLHLKFNGFWENILNKQNPASAYSENVIDDEYKTSRINVGGTFDLKINNEFELLQTGNFTTFVRTTSNYNQNLTTSRRLLLKEVEENFYNFFYRAILRQDAFKTKIKVLYGMDLNVDMLQAQKISNQSKALYEVGFFSMINLQLDEQLFFQPGLRFANNSLFPSTLAPTFNFRYEISKKASARLSYSHGYRNPEIKELFFNFVDNNHNIQGNQNLQTEENDNVQLGFDIKSNKEDDKPHSYSTSFTMSVISKNKAIEIVPVNISKNEFQYQNIGKYNSMVFSVDNRMKINNVMFGLGANISGYSRFYNNTANQISQFLFNGSVNLNCTYTYKPWDTKFTFLSKFYTTNTISVLNITNNKVETTEIPSYVMTDFNASRNFFDKKLSVTVGVKNLFNIKNLSVLGYNGNFHSAAGSNDVNFLWGRSIFTTINLNLSK
jgi:outer membrane receptor for ferrienterochelin and colicins